MFLQPLAGQATEKLLQKPGTLFQLYPNLKFTMSCTFFDLKIEGLVLRHNSKR